ncbi:helix-turn-helix domain-containing protein [Kutzneria sp. NPDC051319]|uniref:helix-turn-helix domain-containing protein n=1 Tax=Kutzneria sp. NPDC051319 TaxID=3155047 RepID=UPI00342ADD59
MSERPSDKRIRGRRREGFARWLKRAFEDDRLSVLTLAEAFDRRPSVVRRMLREAGARGDDVDCVGYADDELRQAIVGRYRRGVSVMMLRQDTGLGERVLRGVLRAAGEHLQAQSAVPTSGAADWRRRYEQGASIREVASEIGCSYGAARLLLLRAGVTLRAGGGRAQPPPPE